MTRATRGTRESRALAARLIVYEAEVGTAAPGGRAGAAGPVGFWVCEKLRPHLATLMGTGGYRALLTRALALAGAEISWLRTIQVGSDGSLANRDELTKSLPPEDQAKGGLALLVEMLGLLSAFIGETLTLRLLAEIWPQLSFNNLDDGKDTHEKAN